MSTSINPASPSINTVNLPVDNEILTSRVGHMIMLLAMNSLVIENRAQSYALEKIKLLKEKGISLSNKLQTSEVHHIVSELRLLEIAFQVAEKQEKPLVESEIKQQILNFSAMSDDELKAMEKDLDNEIKRLEKEIQTKQQVNHFSEILKTLGADNPIINSHLEEYTTLFKAELEAAQDIPDAASRFIERLQTNVKHLSAKMNQTRQHISDLAVQYKLPMTPQYIEQLTLAVFMEHDLGLLLKREDFQSILEQTYAKVVSDPYTQRLMDQMQNETNHQLWNTFLQENQHFEGLALNKFGIALPLKKNEIDQVNVSIAKMMKSNDESWNLSPRTFKERCIQPIADARDRELQKIKERRENQDLIDKLWGKYERSLMKKAKEVHKVTPPEHFLEWHYNNFLKFFPASTLNMTHADFKQHVEHIEEDMKEQVETLWLLHAAKYKKVVNLKQNPAEFVRNVWKKDLGPIEDIKFLSIREQKITQLVAQAIELCSKELSFEDLQKFEESVAGLLPEINRLELKELEQTMHQDKEITKEVVDEIMRDTALIGTRVQYNMSLLDQATKDRIIKHAKKRSLISKVKEDLEHHVLTPNTLVIESKYKKLKELMHDFPDMEEEQRYNLIINKALLQQELLKRKAQSFNRGTSLENQVLKWFNFTPKDSYQSSAAIQLIEDRLQSVKLSEHNADLLKQEIREAEYKGRLKAAGVADNELENIKKLISHINVLEKEIGNLRTLARDAAPLGKFEKLPVIQKLLQGDRYVIVRNEMQDTIKTTVNSLITRGDLSKSGFAETVLPQLDPKTIFDSKYQEKFKETVAKKLNEKGAFYFKWKDRLAVDAIQGYEDEEEALGQGVCLAKCLRVGSFEQAHPEKPVKEIGGEKITPVDRYVQARYSKAQKDLLRIKADVSEKYLGAYTVSKEVVKRLGYNKATILGTSSDEETNKAKCSEELANQLRDLAVDANNADVLKKSNGVVHIGIEGKDWGHALHCRIDNERGTYRLHDPNIGIFEIPADKGNIKAVQDLAELCKDVIEALYPDTKAYNLYQLHN